MNYANGILKCNDKQLGRIIVTLKCLIKTNVVIAKSISNVVYRFVLSNNEVT